VLAVDPTSPIAPFEQLRSGVVDAVASGELTPGDRMPTVRRLAEDLGLAPNTVARAYRELEASGFLETRGRNGTFVAPQGDPAMQQAQRAASVYADRIRALHIDEDRALALVAAALRPGT
jgi:DNA-binding transcriptional regulator YhcF (GntR family)